jgi:hypothetical protein
MAGTIITSPLYTGTLTTIVICEAYNVGDKPIGSVTVTLVPAFGVGDSVTCTDLEPAQFCQDSVPSPPPFSGFTCKITFTGGKKSIRGSISLAGTGNNITAVLPAN